MRRSLILAAALAIAPACGKKKSSNNNPVPPIAEEQDDDAPVVPEAPAITGPSLTNHKQPTWNWATIEGATKYRYKIDSDDLTTGATELTTTEIEAPAVLNEGTHTIYVQAGNDAGWSPSASFITIIDLTAPDGFAMAISRAGKASSSVKVSFTPVTENTYKIIIGTNQTCTSVTKETDAGSEAFVEFTDLAVGSYFICEKVTDAVGNVASSTNDGTALSILVSGSELLNWNKNGVSDLLMTYWGAWFNGTHVYVTGAEENDQDAIIGKYDLTGAEVWRSKIDVGGGIEEGRGIAVGQDGSVYMTGIREEDPTDSDFDWWLKKFTAAGATTGLFDIASGSQSAGSGSSQDNLMTNGTLLANDHLYLFGPSKVSGTLVGRLTRFKTSDGVSDTSCEVSIGPVAIEANGAIASDSQGRIYIGAYQTNAVGASTSADWVVYRYSATCVKDDTFEVKADGNAGIDRITSIAVAADGSIFVTGYALNVVDTASDEDVWFKRFDTLGNEIAAWNKKYDQSNGKERGVGVCAHSDGTAILVSREKIVSGVGHEMKIRKFDAAGTEVATGWSKTVTAAAPAHITINGAHCAEDGSVVVFGNRDDDSSDQYPFAISFAGP